MILVKENRKAELESIMEALKEKETFYNPDGIIIGYVDSIEILDRKTKDNQEYTQIQFNIKATDGKNYNKRYSTDFARKYLVQLGIKAAETVGMAVALKPTGKFKNIGWWAFITGEEIDDGLDYDIQPYQDDSTADIAERLKKLGL